jgi:hypothetical protein
MGLKMSQGKKLSRIQRLKKWNKKADRWIRRHLRRGPGYKIANVFQAAFLVFLGILGIVAISAILARARVSLILDWNTIASIFAADIPVGIILWWAFQRRESENRKLLDAVEITEAPTRYAHLQVHFVDDYDNGIYPELLYYIVNTKSKSAYWVDDKVEDLIEARLIRKFPKHRDVAELNRHFDNNRYVQASRYPQGDDLFRDSPPGDEKPTP